MSRNLLFLTPHSGDTLLEGQTYFYYVRQKSCEGFEEKLMTFVPFADLPVVKGDEWFILKSDNEESS